MVRSLVNNEIVAFSFFQLNQWGIHQCISVIGNTFDHAISSHHSRTVSEEDLSSKKDK